MNRLLQDASPAASNVKATVAHYVASTIIPALQSGSDRIKMHKGCEDEFEPRCNLAKQFLQALGGTPDQSKTPTVVAASEDEAEAALRNLIASATHHKPQAAVNDQGRRSCLLCFTPADLRTPRWLS